MTIKQQGGIFGRNPTFNDVDVEGTLTVDGEVITSPANNAKLDNANEFTQEQEIKVVDATAYDASAVDAQVTVGPSLFLNNPANSNGTVSGQVVFGLRSTPYYARLGATGGSNPNIFVGLGTSEIARFTSSGLAMANGKGIDFSATSGAGTSELFDDYEEGDHEVAVTAGSSGTITVGASSSVLAYTKVGRKVTLMGRILIGSVSSPVGALKISLPFVIGNMTEFGGYVYDTNYFYGNGTGVSDGASYYTYALSGTEGQSTISLFAISRAGVFDTTAADWVGTNSELYVNLTYFTS